MLSYRLLCLLFGLAGSTAITQNTVAFAELEDSLDRIIAEALDSQAFPGAQILVAKDGQTILSKAYGFHTFSKQQAVAVTDLYDLASITKVSTGLAVLMKLHGEGLFDLDASFKEYVPAFRNTDKADLKIREILAHQARLKPYIVYWAKTIKKNGRYKRRTFKHTQSKKYPVRITDQLFLHRKYKKRIYRYIKKSALEEEVMYKYSGLFFLLLPDIIERITGASFESYLYENIYRPIGVDRLLYNPLNKFELSEIVPTEMDTFFRHQQVHGTVHDEAAAMLGGVSCNAGLFGNAESLASLFQLYLNEGVVNDRNILAPESVAEFTRYQFKDSGNRRGLGFDKPLIEYNAARSYIAESASPESYGHSGFTGTFVWADPSNEMLFVLLTNRVCPTRGNRKLYTLNIRPRLHQAVYDFYKK